MKKVVTALFVLLLSTHAWAGTYWVSKSASGQHCTNSTSDPGAGSSSQTIRQGLDCLISAGGAPHTLNIHSGIYNETISGSLPSGTSNTNRIFIKAVDGTGTVLLTGAAGNGNGVITINNPFWEIDGLKLDATNSSHGILIQSNAQNGRYLNMDIANVAMGLCPPVQTCGPSPGNAIQQANIGNGVYEDAGADHQLFFNVAVHDSTSSVADQGGGNCCQGAHGFYITTAFNILDHVLVYNMGQHGVQFFHFGDITTSHDNIIQNSVIHNTGTAGLGGYCLAANGNDSQMLNTVCYSEPSTGIGTGSNGTYYGNTFDNLPSGVTDGGAARTGVIVKNNIFLNVGTPVDNGTSGSGFTHDHNVCNASGSGCDTTGSLNFVNAANHVYTLNTGSVAIGAGTALPGCPSSSAYCFDQAGLTRPQGGTWDAGAFEFASGTSLPVVTITSPTSNAAITVSSALLTLGGSSTQSGGSVAWSCDRCGSGGTTGTVASWSTTTITLKPGINTITVTGTDASANQASDTITVTYAPTFPGNSLVGAWAFEAGTGTSAIDSSGNGNTGTLVNGATWTTGKYGNGILLNGINQYVEVLDSNSLDLTQSFTLSLWAQAAAAHTDFRALVNKNALPNSSPYQLFGGITGFCGDGGIMGMTETNGSVGPRYNACYGSASTPVSGVPTALQVGVRTHLAVTYDGSNLKLYINGHLVATTPASGYIEPSTASLFLGGSEFGEYFDGMIDEVRVYNYALPLTAGSNTSFGATCAAADELSSPSIVGDANCPIIPLTPPIKFEIGASSSFSIGAGSTFAIRAQ